MAEELTVGKLNEITSKADSCDKELFAEYKNNVLLEAGKHWNNAKRQIYNRLKDADAQTKVRLTKNHVSVITNEWKNQILSQAPWVRPFPHAESELQDQKAAEIALSVWSDAKHRYSLQEKRDMWAGYFSIIGETGAVKIFWDPNKGKLVGYKQATDEAGNLLFENHNGEATLDQHVTDELGNILAENQPKKSDEAVMSGDFVFETILPFNLLRDPSCETIKESPYLIIRKMMDVDDAKKLVGGDEEKLNAIKASSETTFKVFDGAKGDYVDSKNQVLVKEIYYRPCHKYPNGLFCIYTSEAILVEPQELPFGIFPIVDPESFKDIATTPRGISVVRDIRPLQANLNQLASQKMQHELTVGDDKLVLAGGSKVEKGSDFPGIRTIKVTGAPPTIISGRAGDHFLPSIQAITEEMYKVGRVEHLFEDLPAQMDPMALLFRSMRQKKAYSGPAEKFERFLTRVCQLFLTLHQKYCPEDTLIKQIGKNEYVNVQEWKGIQEIDYVIKLEAVGEDIESAMGRAMQIQMAMQYAGDKIPAENYPAMLNALPQLNGHEMFKDLLQDQTDAKNIILALDRGEQVQPRRYDNHKYIIKKINSRMRERSFDLLDDQIKQNYEQTLLAHEAFEVEEINQIKMLEQQMIPTSGALVTVQLYESVPNSTGGVKTQYMKFPTDSIMWLKKLMETQGTYVDAVQSLPQTNQAQIAQQTQTSSIPVGQVSNDPMMGQGDMNGSNGQSASGVEPIYG